MNSAAGTTTTGSSSSTPNSPISPTPSSSTASPASILERRNRRRSSALSGSHPAEVPLTDSDHRLAVQVARINWQNAREAALQAPQQPLPTLVVPALDLNSDSSGTPEDPTVSSSIEKTPTQATFRPLSSQRTALSVSRSHTRDGSRSTTTFQLSPIKDESDSKTPTEQDPNTSPIRAEQKLSTVPPLVRNEHRLSPNRIPLSGDYEPSPLSSLAGFSCPHTAHSLGACIRAVLWNLPSLKLKTRVRSNFYLKTPIPKATSNPPILKT